MKVLIASSNPGKLRDFQGAAALYDIQPQLLPGFRQLPEVVEDGLTFAENARKKAEHYSRYAQGELVLADDSGLEVDALGGAPGVHSARYAALALDASKGESPVQGSPTNSGSLGYMQGNSSDEANNARLRRELASVADERRQARFVSVISVARNGAEIASFRGEAQGTLLREPRGNNGFGYDPFFLFPPLGRTFAELSAEEKAVVSHRGQALRRFLDWCREAARR